MSGRGGQLKPYMSVFEVLLVCLTDWQPPRAGNGCSFFDPGKTGIIDKREVAMSLLVLCSASSQSVELDFAFKLFDEDEDKNFVRG